MRERPEYDYHEYDQAVGEAIKASMSGKPVNFMDHYKTPTRARAPTGQAK